MRPRWLTSRRIEDASELDGFLPPDANRTIRPPKPRKPFTLREIACVVIAWAAAVSAVELVLNGAPLL